jgi:prepilin-type N-terminal cleavage/methylation domain-containing protein
MKYTITQSGFSLVEMLVAVSVLLIVIVGPITATSQVAKSSSFATEQVQAFFLAQEGLELAEKIRDDLMLEHFDGSLSNPWSSFTDTAGTYVHCHNANGCGIDWNTATALSSIRNCSTSGNCKLHYRPSAARSRYTHTTTGSEDTPFTRVIRFQNLGTTAVRVTSTVTWRTGSLAAEQRVETSTYLYNIYAKP